MARHSLRWPQPGVKATERMADCMSFVSYAQNGEDVILWRALKHVENGFYVDVGANDPVVDSVTQAFYERGWRGINIEPVKSFYEKLQQDRPDDVNLMVAAGAQSGILTLYEIAGSGLSTNIDEIAQSHAAQGWKVANVTVPVIRLDEICASRGDEPIHFLKIDVEGAEKEVLQGIDLRRLRPWIIVMEATKPLKSERINEIFDGHPVQFDYIPAYFDGINSYFVAKEHADLAEVLAVQPNFFDQSEHISVRQLKEEVDRLRGEVAHTRALQAQVQDAQERLAVAEEERSELGGLRVEMPRLEEEIEWLRRDQASRLQHAAEQVATAERRLAELDRLMADGEQRVAAHEWMLSHAWSELRRVERHWAVRTLWSFALFAPHPVPGRKKAKKPRLGRIFDGIYRKAAKLRKKMKKKGKKNKKKNLAGATVPAMVPAGMAAAPMLAPPPSLSPDAARSFRQLTSSGPRPTSKPD